MTDTSDVDGDTSPVSVRVLVPDGGELEPPEEAENEEADEAEDDASADEENGEVSADEVDTSEDEEGTPEERQQDDEASDTDETEGDEGEEETEGDEGEEETEGDEGEEETEGDEGEEEDERAEADADEGSRLIHLNLDGLFLDLLGLEVDLDEITLDLTARPGEGNLLGNLLSAVSGLLDGSGLGSLFGGGDAEDEGESLISLPSLPSLPDLNPMERARALAGALAQRIRDVIGDIVSALPLEDLLTEFLQELVGQLLDSGNGEDDDAASA